LEKEVAMTPSQIKRRGRMGLGQAKLWPKKKLFSLLPKGREELKQASVQ